LECKKQIFKAYLKTIRKEICHKKIYIKKFNFCTFLEKLKKATPILPLIKAWEKSCTKISIFDFRAKSVLKKDPAFKQ
jgi:hypothetical protein